MLYTQSCETIQQVHFDTQGHRGCRGLYPENSILGFKHALDLGVKTLEPDVVISKDKKVVVSHEPFLSHEICLDLSGKQIHQKDERSYNIYQMTYDEIRQFDCGSTHHNRFPNQKKTSTFKPLLSEVIQLAEQHSQVIKRALPYYNIETKSTSSGDHIFHPTPEEFVNLLIIELNNHEVLDRCIIQSFDIRTLQYLHQKYPKVKTALLIEHPSNAKENIEHLGFTPTIYSCDFTLLTEAEVDFCHQQNVLVIPWTVNEVEDMKRLIDMGVDGIISDYPDRLIELTKNRLTKKAFH